MASADYAVLTPERVSLEYGIAGIGSRGGATMLDTLIQCVALFVVAAAGLGAAGAMSLATGRFTTVILLAVTALGLFAIATGYFMLFEILWNGQTPGKRALGLRVIRESGYPIRPVDSVIRNLVRVVDWLPLFYGLGVLLMLFNGRSKRLGDFAAGTIVVREGTRRALSSLAPAPEPAMDMADAPVALALSPADATLVRDFLVRRTSMHPSARADLARRLATALAHRYQLVIDEEPEHFLDRLAG
jgi:uncharacterized RDD family membrane protein YckC